MVGPLSQDLRCRLMRLRGLAKPHARQKDVWQMQISSYPYGPARPRGLGHGVGLHLQSAMSVCPNFRLRRQCDSCAVLGRRRREKAVYIGEPNTTARFYECYFESKFTLMVAHL